MTLYRGMLPWRHDALKLNLDRYLNRDKLPPIPKTFGHVGATPPDLPDAEPGYPFGLYGNDTAGDCVMAGCVHEHIVWAMATKRPLPSFSTANVLAQYFSLTGGEDTGLDPIAAAQWRCSTGIKDLDGNFHKDKVFAAVDRIDIKVAAYLFGVCGLGLTLPSTAEQQFENGHIWDDTRHPGQDGHYVPVVGFSNGNYSVISWGRIQKMTPQYLSKYLAGGVAYLSLEYLLDTGKSPEAVDAAQLQADLEQLRA